MRYKATLTVEAQSPAVFHNGTNVCVLETSGETPALAVQNLTALAYTYEDLHPEGVNNEASLALLDARYYVLQEESLVLTEPGTYGYRLEECGVVTVSIEPMVMLLPPEVIRGVFLSNGFMVKPGQTDLKHYVYAAADALLRRYTQDQPVQGTVTLPTGLVQALLNVLDRNCNERGLVAQGELAEEIRNTGVWK